jgi:hypothetical protein
MRMPSAITNMFEDIRDAALKGSVLGSMQVTYETTNGVAGTFNFPGDDKTIKSEAELVTVLNKKVATVGNLQKLKIEALQPYDFRLKYANLARQIFILSFPRRYLSCSGARRTLFCVLRG